MRINRFSLSWLTVKFLMIFAIFSQGIVTSSYGQEKDNFLLSFHKGNGSVTWEPQPRKVFSGSGGQLSVRASESMNLLFAAHNKQGKQDVFFAKSKTIGDRFSKPIRVNSEPGEVSAHGENDAQLRSGKGRGIFAAWVGQRNIKFARSINFGRSFGSAIRVNDDSGKASQSFFNMEVSPDGTIIIAWLDGRDKKINAPGTSSLYVARSTDRGVTFKKNIKVAGNICPCCRPSIAFGESGTVFVSWRHVYQGNDRIIVVASSSDGGLTWGKPIPVTTTGWKINGCAHAGPALTYANGKLYVVWYTGTGMKARLKLAYSKDNGKTFEGVQEIQANILDPNHPHMAKVGEEPWIVFQGRDPVLDGGWGLSQAWLVRISKDGMPGKPERLPSNGRGVSYPQLFPGNGGRVYAMWTQSGPEGPEVMLCRGRLLF